MTFQKAAPFSRLWMLQLKPIRKKELSLSLVFLTDR